MSHPDPMDVLSLIYQRLGVTFSGRIGVVLMQWIKRRLENDHAILQYRETIREHEAQTFFNDLLVQLDSMAVGLPPEDITCVQLSTAVEILRSINPLHLYMTTLESCQSLVTPALVCKQANYLLQLVTQKEYSFKMTPMQHELNVVAGLANELQIIVQRATIIANLLIGTFLRDWRIKQDRHGLDHRGLATALDTIQQSGEVLAAVIWTVWELIKAIPDLGEQVNLTELVHRTKDLLGLLVTKCFIVEIQPPRVIKTNTKYSIGIRHLLGGQLSSRMTETRLQMRIVSEVQACDIQKANTVNNESSGELASDDGVIGTVISTSPGLHLNQETGHLEATFRNLQVRRINRQDRRGTDSVTGEKFAFLFDLCFDVGDLRFTVWTITQPVVVIVHGVQELAANATIVWDNAFADPCRIPFVVRDEIAWNILAEMLNQKTKSMKLTHPLSAENLHFLGEKVTRKRLQFPVPDAELVTKAQFCRDMIPMHSFTFWEWFYATMKITAEAPLMGIWNEGLIIGFIDRHRAECDLLRHPPGTFLLRFSESQQGGITIAFVNDKPIRGIEHINPFVGKDAINVVAAIRDFPQLKFLYPGIPKEEAFKRHFPPKVQTVSGYVPAVPAAPQVNNLNNNQPARGLVGYVNQEDLMDFRQ